MYKKLQTVAAIGILALISTISIVAPESHAQEITEQTVQQGTLPANVPGFTSVPMKQPGKTSAPPIPGDDGGLSWYDERQIGDQIAYEIQKDIIHERDIILYDYVNFIWQELIRGARNNGELSQDLYQQMAWKMFLIQDPSVNAFALPGAYIGVNLGLVSMVTSRDELASVLAHETVHIVQRHIARMYGKNTQFSVMSLASLIVGAIAASADPNAGIAIMLGGQAAAAQGQINFTRAMEYEADRIGYRVLVDSGFHPQGMADMFKVLQQASRFSDSSSFPYLRTHPLDNQRIAEAQTRIGITKNAKPAIDYQQAMMSARAGVLANPNPDDLRKIIANANPGNNAPLIQRIANLYAGVLAATKLRQYATADKLLEQLQTTVATLGNTKFDRIVALQGVESALEEGNADKARKWLATGFASNAPELVRPEILLQAKVNIALGEPQKVIGALTSWTVQHHDDEIAWQILASAYAMNQQKVLSLRAEGEARMATLDYGGAIDRFKAALKQGRQGAELADLEVVQARLKIAEQAQKDRMAFEL